MGDCLFAAAAAARLTAPQVQMTIFPLQCQLHCPQICGQCDCQVAVDVSLVMCLAKQRLKPAMYVGMTVPVVLSVQQQQQQQERHSLILLG